MARKLIYVDSNYWIYWIDSRLPEHKYTREVMKSAISNGIILNFVTLIEIAHYLRRLPPDEYSRILERIQNLSTLTLIDLDDQVTQRTLEIIPEYAQRGLGGRDCAIIATMRLYGVSRIATHDKAFKKIEGLQVVDSIP